MKVSIASDHAGFRYKEKIKDYLIKKGFEVFDHGAFSADISVDYPDFIKLAAIDVASYKTDIGIGVCGSGVGVSIVANKIKGVRAALVVNKEMASMAKKHNNANFLALGERIIAEKDILGIIDAWLGSEFEGGRHLNRIKKIDEL